MVSSKVHSDNSNKIITSTRLNLFIVIKQFYVNVKAMDNSISIRIVKDFRQLRIWEAKDG